MCSVVVDQTLGGAGYCYSGDRLGAGGGGWRRKVTNVAFMWRVYKHEFSFLSFINHKYAKLTL
jgi:hypothetical protein